MTLTEAQIRTLYPAAPEAHVSAFRDGHEKLFTRFGIDGGNRLDYFLAQVGHESGGLTIDRENLNYRAERLPVVWPGRFPTVESARPYAGNPEKLANFVYAGRMGNGDAASGDGWRYRGRGYIQVTGRDGYAEVGAITKLDLEGDPDLAFAPENALLVACGFWRWKKLNPVCDAGDFERVTRIINGGTNGLEDRRAWLDKVRRVLGGTAPADGLPDVATIIAVQRALRERGYTAIGAADGIVGDRTRAAIKAFREARGLPDGLIDETLLAALGFPTLDRGLAG